MQEVSILSGDLEGLDQALKRAQRRSPAIGRQVLGALGQELLEQVRGNIGGTGKVQRWQHEHLGSGGGYVAVHAAEKEQTADGYAVGRVTNAVESGHVVRPPSGKSKRYRSRATKTRVAGKGMYSRVDPGLAAQGAARQLEERLARELEE